MKKVWFPLLLALLIALPSCSNKGGLKEGKCKGIVSLELPKVLSYMEDEVRESFDVTVRLKNPETGKEYVVTLNEKNDYEKKLSLKPGVYEVEEVSSKTGEEIGLRVATSASSMTFDQETEASLSIMFPNLENFSQKWINNRPLGEIELADKFSKQIQINRKIISLQDVLGEISCDQDLNETLEPSKETVVTDSDKGISVTLKNLTSGTLPRSSCTVTGILVTKNTVIFPDAVTTSSLPKEVCHQKNGVYGEPDYFQGSTLYGWNLRETVATYEDKDSGVQVLIHLCPDGSAIQGIEVKLANLD